MESEYRVFWELPYSEDIKFGLLKSFLQSRAVISWLKGIKDTNLYDMESTSFKYRDGADVAMESIGGATAEDILNKAKTVERLIYDISASLLPPPENKLQPETIAPYHPFDAIEVINVKLRSKQEIIHLQPLVILDDVHSLHPQQLFHMREWLAKREMKISRWMLMRLDAQTPKSVLLEEFISNSGIDEETTIKRSREITSIWLQNNDDRGTNRKKFRAMAQSMANKYLRLMPVFNRQGLSSLQDLLNTQPTQITEPNYLKLKKKVDNFQSRTHIGMDIREMLEREIERYFLGAINIDDKKDVKLAMLYILMNRYTKRVPQPSLFEEGNSPVPNKPITADSG